MGGRGGPGVVSLEIRQHSQIVLLCLLDSEAPLTKISDAWLEPFSVNLGSYSVANSAPAIYYYFVQMVKILENCTIKLVDILRELFSTELRDFFRTTCK